MLRALVPNVETLGYYRMSLRDKDLPGFAGVLGDQILTALDLLVCRLQGPLAPRGVGDSINWQVGDLPHSSPK